MPDTDEDNEGKILFAARKAIMEHFTQKRLDVKGEGFAKQGVLGIINSYEKEALDKAERTGFAKTAEILAEFDRKIESESKHFREKMAFAQSRSD